MLLDFCVFALELRLLIFQGLSELRFDIYAGIRWGNRPLVDALNNGKLISKFKLHLVYIRLQEFNLGCVQILGRHLNTFSQIDICLDFADHIMHLISSYKLRFDGADGLFE